MGDLIGQEVSGTLKYIPFREFERIRKSAIQNIEKAKIFADLCRINTIYMIAKAGSGHIGSSFSCIDILSWLYLFEMSGDVNNKNDKNSDIFFSSKGHDAPALYSVLIGLGKLDFELLHKLRRINGLPGHPDILTPCIITNTGSLGMGISKAKGMIYANRKLGKKVQVFVITGDGELQEGQLWESLISAANNKFSELTVIIDHNKLQSDTVVTKVSDLGDLEAKFTAFGWHVARCNGNDISDFSRTLSYLKDIKEIPKIIIADTIKGKGVSFMEHTSIDSDVELYKYHSGAPSSDAYIMASYELIETLNINLEKNGVDLLDIEIVNRPRIISSDNTFQMIPTYSRALLEHSRKNDKIIALDADLVKDTGLLTFKSEFLDRFLECGIAEQDMISQAGGIALMGLLPIVHSFACFLSSRPNEQIYNNATENTKIIYVGSLAGLLPAGPGHSHQAVRDIGSLSSIPNLILVAPSCERDLTLLVEWAINKNEKSTYIRLESLPVELNFDCNNWDKIEIGKGIQISDGDDIIIIGYGSLMLSEAMKVSRKFYDEKKVKIKVINLPWLNCIDEKWLIQTLENSKIVIAIDNHYTTGGQGDRISKILSNVNVKSYQLYNLGVDEVPLSGQNNEVLSYHKLDFLSIFNFINGKLILLD